MLRLYSNRISRLPAAIGLLVNLQVLWVFDNRIVTIAPEIGKLTSLTNMSIDRNPVVKLPIQLGACKAISKFDFSPESIVFPPAEVLLGGDKSIFDFLGRLHEASLSKSLVFASYGLKSLPADMLECTSLTELLLYGNDIQRLPPRLALLTDLTSFKIDEPTLRFPPQEVSRVSHQKIFEFLRLFQESVKSLKLNISRFQLMSAPAECFDTWNLRCLDLSQNVISTIPDAISKLTRLHTLDVSHNKIAFFAESLGSVTTLTALFCNDNSLVQMPNDLFESLGVLAQLHMQNNCISKLPPSISCLSSLREFRLENNSLKSLPHGLTNLVNLQELNLQDNMLSAVPTDLGALKRLSNLNVFQNHDLKSPPFEVAMCCNNPVLLKGDSDEEDDVCDTDDEGNAAKKSANRSFSGQPRWKSDPPYQKPSPLIRYLWGLYDALHGVSLQSAGTGLLSVPSVFLELLHLKSINISFNRLHKLPASFTLLSQLQVINVSHNMFASLDSVFAGMLQITHVNVSYNFLETLPKEFGACEALEELECSGNPLALPSEEIFRIGPQAVVLYLRQVNIALHTYVLTLSNRHLEVFPEQLADFDFIRTLDFSHNDIRRLPGALGTMTQLTRLDFSHNNLMSFPLGLDGLSNLISLNLNYNSLKELPVTFSCLRSLTNLDVSCNVLVSLPETLGGMSLLEHLDCSRNELCDLPASLSSLVKLKEMNVSYNQIIHTPLGLSCLTSLQTCSFKCNKLLVLPSGLGVLPNLKDLQWDLNPYLSPMRQAADEFDCPKIISMLQQLAAASRDSQKKLLWDNFGFRHFPDYDADIFTFNTTGWFVRGLKTLNLEHNKIIAFPDSFSRLSALTVLDISYNGTVHLPNSMSCLSSLNTLKMRDCRCVALPAGLGLSKALMRINCSGFDTQSPPAEVRRKHAQVSARYLRGVFFARYADLLDWSATEIMTLRALPIAFAKNEYLPCNILTLLLSNNGLTELTSVVISSCTRVKHIDISNNFISDLPACLGELAYLESFCAESNCLSRIPDDLGRLSSLNCLTIDRNLHINDPPSDVSDTILFVKRVSQSKLTKCLDLCSLNLREIPISVVLYAGIITDLNLSGNQISIIPSSFALLTSIKSLNLSSNFIHTLNAGIALLTLEHLHLNQNRLCFLPPELCLCTSLKHLNLKDNPWQSPSNELLECSVQAILSYLSCFLDARQSCEIWLRDLPVSRFPMESFFLSNATKLVALDCNISEMPSSCFRLSRVQNLDLSRNSFEGTLDTGLCHFKGLVRCNLSHNKIRSLPMCLGFACLLQHLDVSHNNLYTLPPSLCRCSDLSTVDVRHNFITRLPARMGLCSRVTSFLCDTGPENLYISPANPVPSQSADQIIRYLLEVFNSWTSGFLNLEGFALTFVPYDVLSFIGVEYQKPFPKMEPCPLFSPRNIEIALESSQIQKARFAQFESEALEWESEGPSVPLRGVILSGNSIVELPDSFGDLSGISGDLNLSDNCLISIPKSIGNLFNVTNLNLSGNSLTLLPDEISKLTAMTALTIDSNAIELLPVCIVTLSQLVKLSFSSNNIVYVPWQIGFRAHLFQQFEYSANPLRFPHPSIQNLGWKAVLNYLHRGALCVSNNVLDFSCLPLTSFDFQMDHLTSATALYLNDSAIASFQDHFTLLTQLTILKGQRLKIQTLHKCIGNFKSLQIIHFACCPLTKGIPESLAECSLMRDMIFRNCYLSELNDDLFATMLHLRFLDFSGNFLTCMPATLKNCTSLTSLCLESNLLTSVCKGTSCWSQLTEINISHNSIENLPRGLGGLFHTCKLKTVNIAFNPVKMPPPFIMSQGLETCLKYLFRLWRSKISNGLDLEQFKITSIGTEMTSLAYLEQLHLENNILTLLPASISRLTCLKELILSHNRLSDLPNELFSMKSISNLIVDDNRLVRISPRIGQMDSLEVLNLENNSVNTLPLDICLCRSMQVLQISIPNLQADYRDLLKESCDVLFQYLSAFKAFRSSKRVILPHKTSTPWPQLKVFPAQAFVSVASVTEMNLEDNQLTKIPGSITLLSCLTNLSLARNLLSQITPALYELRQLKLLNITENERTLEDPPPSISSLGTDGTKKVLSYLSCLRFVNLFERVLLCPVTLLQCGCKGKVF
jgi:Leucine-rich repeat (LRR) protein